MAAKSFDSANHVQAAMNDLDSITNSLERHKPIDPSDIENLRESLFKLIDNKIFAELYEKAIALLEAISNKTAALFEVEEKNRKDIQELRKQVTELQKDLKQTKAELDQKQEQLDMMTVCQVVSTIEDMVIDQVLPMNKTLNPGDRIYLIHKMEKYLNEETFEGTEEERQAAISRWEELQSNIGWTKTYKMKNTFYRVKEHRVGIAHDKQPPDVVNKTYSKLLSMKKSDRKFQDDKWHFDKCIEIYEALWAVSN